MNGFWFAILIPFACNRCAARYTAIPMFEQQLAESGLNLVNVDVPEEPLMKLDLYLDVNGPFNEVFRKSDSKFSLASEKEL